MPSGRFPRVDDLDTQSREILDVAGDDGEIMLQRGRGYKAVNVRQRRSFIKPAGRQDAPTFGDHPRDRKNALLKPLVEVAIQPLLQFVSALTVRKPFDSLADFAETQDARPQEIGTGRSQPGGNTGVRAVAPLEF